MYIDTSCLVAFYMPEELSSKVHEMITTADTVSVSSITVVEFLSALKKKARMGLSSITEIEIAFKKFNDHITKGFYQHIEVGENHFNNATDLLLQSSMSLRVLDAIHLGISREEKIIISSNDITLLEAADEFNIRKVEI